MRIAMVVMTMAVFDGFQPFRDGDDQCICPGRIFHQAEQPVIKASSVSYDEVGLGHQPCLLGCRLPSVGVRACWDQ